VLPDDDTGLPDDPAIPALAAIRDEGLAAVLAGAGIAGGRGPVAVLKHHTGDRCTFSAESVRGPVVVKATRAPVDAAIALHDGLARAGLASGSAPTAAPVLGVDRTRRILVSARFDGPTGNDLIAAGDGERAGALAVAWLQAGWKAAVDVGEAREPVAVVEDVQGWTAAIAAHDPTLGDHAASVTRTLTQTPPDPAPAGLVHGSFYPAHLFDLGDGPGVIDWDTAHCGRPEHDVGMFLAVIRKSRLGREKAPRAAARAMATLLAAVDGAVEPAAVWWFEAAFVLKFASYIAKRGKPGWQARVGALIEESGALAAGVTPPGHP
jgi:hypothetical protein